MPLVFRFCTILLFFLVGLCFKKSEAYVVLPLPKHLGAHVPIRGRYMPGPPINFGPSLCRSPWVSFIRPPQNCFYSRGFPFAPMFPGHPGFSRIGFRSSGSWYSSGGYSSRSSRSSRRFTSRSSGSSSRSTSGSDSSSGSQTAEVALEPAPVVESTPSTFAANTLPEDSRYGAGGEPVPQPVAVARTAAVETPPPRDPTPVTKTEPVPVERVEESRPSAETRATVETREVARPTVPDPQAVQGTEATAPCVGPKCSDLAAAASEVMSVISFAFLEDTSPREVCSLAWNARKTLAVIHQNCEIMGDDYALYNPTLGGVLGENGSKVQGMSHDKKDRPTLMDKRGVHRQVDDVSLLWRSHYYTPHKAKPSDFGSCDIRGSQEAPASFHYGGQPLIDNKTLEIDIRQKRQGYNGEFLHRGLDCTGFIAAAMARSCMKYSVADANPVDTDNLDRFGEAGKHKTRLWGTKQLVEGTDESCLETVQFNGKNTIQSGDILAIKPGHAMIIESVGRDPWGIERAINRGEVKAIGDCTYEKLFGKGDSYSLNSLQTELNFRVVHSTSSTGGDPSTNSAMGAQRTEIAHYVIGKSRKGMGANQLNVLMHMRLMACFAHFGRELKMDGCYGSPSGYDCKKGSVFNIRRHKSTDPRCFYSDDMCAKLKFKDEQCLNDCPGATREAQCK